MYKCKITKLPLYSGHVGQLQVLGTCINNQNVGRRVSVDSVGECRKIFEIISRAAAADARRSSGKTRRRPACNRAAWRIAGAGGPMAGCQGPFARKNPIHRGAQRVNPKIFRPGGGGEVT